MFFGKTAPQPESQADELAALTRTVHALQSRLDELEGAVAENRMRYLEAIDRVIGRLQGRLARRLRDESREDAPRATIDEPDASRDPPQLIAPRIPSTEHLARRFRIGG